MFGIYFTPTYFAPTYFPGFEGGEVSSSAIHITLNGMSDVHQSLLAAGFTHINLIGMEDTQFNCEGTDLTNQTLAAVSGKYKQLKSS